ncbi:hypothetical protein A1D31_36735 [Bradyrhizobium liaoningense]|nr:hypothetical protein A1D31_36735 [Bradyrhizobium liaoningense]
MSVYDPLRDMLITNTSRSVKMAFIDIEKLIGRSLPSSAYEYDAWWANEDPELTTHSQSKAWTIAGYHAEPSLAQRTVTFRRK